MQQQRVPIEVASVSVIDKFNSLAIHRSYMQDCTDSSLFVFQIYSSLDMVESILRNKLMETVESEIPMSQFTPPYLGYLYSIGLPENTYDLYGYVTTTKDKVIILLKQKKNLERTNVQPLCKGLHNFHLAIKCSVFGYNDWDKQIDYFVQEYRNNKFQT